MVMEIRWKRYCVSNRSDVTMVNLLQIIIIIIVAAAASAAVAVVVVWYSKHTFCYFVHY